MGMEDFLKSILPPDFLDKIKTSVETLAKKLDNIESKIDKLIEDKDNGRKTKTKWNNRRNNKRKYWKH